MKDGAMQVPKFRLDGTLTLGNVLQIASILGGILLLYTQGIQWKTEVDLWRVGVDSSLKTVESNRAINLPRINSLEKSDQLQDVRMTNLGEAFIDIRKSVTSIGDKLDDYGQKLSEIATTIAVIEERTKKEKDSN